jgi:opacity protein-like surface antigen
MGKLASDSENEGFNGKMGFGGGANFDYFIVENFAIGVDGGYATLGSDWEGLTDTKATTLHFGAHGKYMVPTGGPLMPYLFAGGGFYSAKVTDIPGEDDLSQSKFGLNAGVGVEYMVSDMVGIGVNGAYQMALGKFEPEINGTKEEVLKDWNYIEFNAAVTFHLPMAK